MQEAIYEFFEFLSYFFQAYRQECPWEENMDISFQRRPSPLQSSLGYGIIVNSSICVRHPQKSVCIPERSPL